MIKYAAKLSIKHTYVLRTFGRRNAEQLLGRQRKGALVMAHGDVVDAVGGEASGSEQGTPIVFCIECPLRVTRQQGQFQRVPERERVTDVDAILAACTDATRLVFIANPNNPTGTMIGEGELSRLADGLPDHVLLVIDGAYAEYVDGYDGGARLVDSRENVVMTRTLSKLYGLGGLRVGWGYGPQHVIDVLNRIRGPFNLGQPALVTAEAAVRDTAWAEKCRNDNTRLRAWLAEALAGHGVPSDTSMANFILARFGSQQEAEACDTYLKSEGLIVRRVHGYKLPNCLRITVGDEPSCRRVAHAVGQFMGDE
mgnify:CR=1 FL=1